MCRLDEARHVSDAQVETGVRQGGDQVGARPRPEVDRDVDVGAQPRDAVQNGRLGAEEIPAHAQAGEAALELGQQLSYRRRSEENTSELQSLMRNSYAVFGL